MTAESNSTKLSEPKASNAGLWAATALPSETPHSTTIQANVIACSRTMCCLTSAGDKHCALLNSACGSPIWTNCDMARPIIRAARSLKRRMLGFHLQRIDHPLLHMGIVLIGKPIVVSFGRQQIEQPATARAGKHATCQPLVESWSPRGVQTPQRRPVASTGVHGASC